MGAINISDSEPEGDEEGLKGDLSISSQSSSAEVKKLQEDTKALDKVQKKEEEVVEVGRGESRKRKLDDEPLALSSLKHHYYYFCLDCESENPGSKFPVTLDIASHIMEKGHTNFQPISDVINDRGHVFIENITYSPDLNKKVSKEWQRLVFNAKSEAELKTFKYSSARKCLKCDEKFRDSADMFIHIRNAHVRKSVNKICEK